MFKNKKPIFQDDQDGKQRTKYVMKTIHELFTERIEPAFGDAKLAYVWPIENVWGAINEKLRSKEFKTETSLLTEITKHWKTFTPLKCQQMISTILERLKKVIENYGNQIYEH